MGEISSNLGDIHLHKKENKYGKRSSMLRHIHLQKKANKYVRDIEQLGRYTSS